MVDSDKTEDSSVRPIGSMWRLLVRTGTKSVEYANSGIFDELVVDKWLHIEQLDERCWWLRIGDARVEVRFDQSEDPIVDILRGYYAEIKGESGNHEPTSA